MDGKPEDVVKNQDAPDRNRTHPREHVDPHENDEPSLQHEQTGESVTAPEDTLGG